MTLNFNRLALAALALPALLTGCKPDLADSPKSSAGSADFSRYVAVGNSLTAGYADGGLYLEGQVNSYPNMLATQFKAVGGGEFVQPLFASNQANGSGYLTITGFTVPATPQQTAGPIFGSETSNVAFVPGSLAPLIPGTQTPSINLLAKFTGSGNQNLGVPGIRVADVQTPGYGFNNPQGFNNFFERLLPAALPGAGATYQQYVQQQVTAVNPTFFTNWLGNNDVLGYATSGGLAPLTDVAEFTAKYAAVTDVLTSGNAKGLLATIPTVTSIPFFRTVTTAGVNASLSAVPVPANIIAGLTAAPLGLTPAQIRDIRFGLFIEAVNAAGAVITREATAADLLVLPASSVVGRPSVTTNPFPRGFGIVIPGISAAQAAGIAGAIPPNPLPNAFALDAAEITAAATRTTAFNDAIKAVAARKGLALFDAQVFFDGIARNGFVTNGVTNTAAYVSGNLFSLDGVHPTPRGYAVIANEMVKTINSYYGAAVPGLDANNFRGVKFP